LPKFKKYGIISLKFSPKQRRARLADAKTPEFNRFRQVKGIFAHRPAPGIGPQPPAGQYNPTKLPGKPTE